jgi:hypothetical protein
MGKDRDQIINFEPELDYIALVNWNETPAIFNDLFVNHVFSTGDPAIQDTVVTVRHSLPGNIQGNSVVVLNDVTVQADRVLIFADDPFLV